MAFQVNSDSVLWQVADGAAVVIHTDSSEYFSLNPSGTVLWEHLALGPQSPAGLAPLLGSSSGRDDTDLETEIADFLQELGRTGLVIEVDTPAAATPSPSPPARSSATTGALAEPPTVVMLGELETLVLSGE